MDCNSRDRCRNYVPDPFDRHLHNLALVPTQLKRGCPCRMGKGRYFLPRNFSRQIAVGSSNNEKIDSDFAALLLIGGNVLVGSFRVHSSIRGSGRDITVQAESSAEARRTVMEMFPGALLTGVHRVKLREALRKLERWFWIHFVRIDNGTDLCFWLARNAREFSESRPVFPSTKNLESFHYLIYTHDMQALALGRRPSQTLCRSRMLPEI